MLLSARSRMVAMVVATLVATGFLTVSTQGRANADPGCQNGGYYIIFARGSNSGLHSADQQTFLGHLLYLLPSAAWAELGNFDGANPGGSGEYPAVPVWNFSPNYGASIEIGRNELVGYLNRRVAPVSAGGMGCDRETIIIGGYSAGADVVGWALNSGDLSSAAKQQLGYVALYGDPRYNRRCDRSQWWRKAPDSVPCGVNGKLGARDEYAPSNFQGRFGSWCDGYDGFCNDGFYPGNHIDVYRQYWYWRSARTIASAAVQKRNQLNPAAAPQVLGAYDPGDPQSPPPALWDTPPPRPSTAPPVPWSFENLDGDAGAISPHDANLGAQPATVEFNGQMYAFYYDVDGGNLRYARTAPNWVFDILDGAGGGVGQVNGNVGQTPAVAVYGNTMHVLYYDAGNGNLRHAWTGNGTNWNFENFDGAPGSVCGLNADLGQTPTLIAYGGTLQALYYDATHGNLRHAWADQNGWHCENLEGDPYTISGRDANIGLDPVLMVYGNTLQALYYDVTTGNLRHAWVDPTTGWHFENLDGDPASICGRDSDIGKNPTLTVYGQTLQAFYYDQSHGDLRHAWVDPVTGWHCETLDGDAGSVVGYDSDVGATPVAVAYGNTLQVFAYEPRWGALRHYWLDTSWHGENLDGFGGQANRINGNVGIDPAAVVVGGYLHVLYYDVQYGNLRHVRPN